MRRNRGFTLIELLVVIAIIALLVSILVPSLSRARRLAQEAVCGSQVRALLQATLVYAAEYDGDLPYMYSDPSVAPADRASDPDRVTTAGYYWIRGTWRDILVEEYGMSRSIFYSPTNPKWESDLFWDTSTDPGWGKVGCCVMGYVYLRDAANLKAARIIATEPDATDPLFPSRIENDAYYDWIWMDMTIQIDFEWNATRTNHLYNQPEPAGAHVGHLDGHVEWRPGSEILPRSSFYTWPTYGW